MAKPTHNTRVIHIVSVLIAWWLVSMAFLAFALPVAARLRSANAASAAGACEALCVVFAAGWLLILLPQPKNASRNRIIRHLGRLSIPSRIPVGALLGMALFLAISGISAIAAR